MLSVQPSFNDGTPISNEQGDFMLRIVSFAMCRETVSVLRGLLEKALLAQIRGLALCYWTNSGQSVVLLTGAYRSQPEHALSAADLIKVAAAHQMDLFA